MGRFSLSEALKNIDIPGKSKPKPGPGIPAPAPYTLPSYAETIPRDPGYGVTAAEPRECRQMLREMYALRVMIASLTFVQPAGQPMVRAKKVRAEAALKELKARVDAWLAVEKGWSAKEMQTIFQIQELIMKMPPIVLPFDNVDEPEPVRERTYPPSVASIRTNTTATTGIHGASRVGTPGTRDTSTTYPTTYTSPRESSRGSMLTRPRSTAQDNSTFTAGSNN
jgi:hypothetical protein